MKKVLGLFLIVLLVSSCSEYEKLIAPARNNKEKKGDQSFDGQKEPAFPDENENNKTLQGVDTNNNGIRDDVDIWINYVGKNRNERMALRQLAQNLQITMKYDERTPKAEREIIAANVWDAMGCLGFLQKEIAPTDRLYPKIFDVIFNSEERVNADRKFHTRGMVYSPTHRDKTAGRNYLMCNFDIDNLNDYFVEK